MSIPPDTYSNPSPYLELVKRIKQQMQQKKVDEQLLQIIQQAFEKVFEDEHIILARPEKARLLKQVTKAVLAEASAKADALE
jgi:hypothetical protein